jgi:SAM-dependent methyltransferase
MKVFNSYARYYDLIYRDKDYSREAEFVTGLLKKWSPQAKTVLELGCGTGLHAMLLAEQNYAVHGVDMSAEMLERSWARRSHLPEWKQKNLNFSEGDVRTLKMNKTFDVVISLFHVMSYQISNQDLLSSFQVAKAHLNPGGIFLFDCWYGPGVLTDRPTRRIKKLEDDSIRVDRIAEPIVYPNENRVDVNYSVTVTDKLTGNTEEIKETHAMRYLFRPELELFLHQAGLILINSGEWLTGREPAFDTWGAYFVARS